MSAGTTATANTPLAGTASAAATVATSALDATPFVAADVSGAGGGVVDNIVEVGGSEYGVMLADNDVANGFVKDGSSLPYVFETNESGARKRSSKILPVCGMCGKKFVCVTTMKRHLVTHTGEKPFSCKVCGKQYTQKGNLRVHERTHRNDRPFECNICTQKFYRKEPMQKHQWRQHGIAHLKSRPGTTTATATAGTNNNNNAGSNTATAGTINNNNTTTLNIIGSEGLLYKSLNASVIGGSSSTTTRTTTSVQESSAIRTGNQVPLQECGSIRTSSAAPAQDGSSTLTFCSPAVAQVIASSVASGDQVLSGQDDSNHFSNNNNNNIHHLQQSADTDGLARVLVEQDVDGEYQVVTTSLESLQNLGHTATLLTTDANCGLNTGYLDSPVAYIVESTEEEVQYASIEVYTEETVHENMGQETIFLDTKDVEGFAAVAEETVNYETADNTHQAQLHLETEPELEPSPADDTNHSNSQEHDSTTQKPVKLKMKLAQAYLREIEESREVEIMQEQRNGGRDQLAGQHRLEYNISNISLMSNSPTTITEMTQSEEASVHVEQQTLESIVAKLTIPTSSGTGASAENVVKPEVPNDHPDTLEFLCKSCGSMCQVSDPYSFRCGTCNMKYTSLPTHLIAEPLQCIGCVQIFAHKPALKQHQSSGVKERPFKCCKCGFEFRQKAHLQKHQWRIHRKKYDSGDNLAKDGEHLPEAAGVEDQYQTAEAPSTEKPIEQVQKLIADQEASPLDLSPAKMYGTAGSITKWVQQVETARTPLKPDISIHKAPAPSTAASSDQMITFKDILSRPPVNQLQQQDRVELHLVNPLNGGKQETLTVHLRHETKSCERQGPSPTAGHAPVYAFKSRPGAVLHNKKESQLRQSNELENNPLINQIVEASIAPAASAASGHLTVFPAPSYPCPRTPKRARTEDADTSQPADLRLTSSTSMAATDSAHIAAAHTLKLNRHTPLAASTPLNLSSTSDSVHQGRSTAAATSPQISPYDYRISKSVGISGHFQRLKSQDERSGI